MNENLESAQILEITTSKNIAQCIRELLKKGFENFEPILSNEKIIGYYPASLHKQTPARKLKLKRIANRLKKTNFTQSDVVGYYYQIGIALGTNRLDIKKEAFANMREYMVLTEEFYGKQFYNAENFIKKFAD